MMVFPVKGSKDERTSFQGEGGRLLLFDIFIIYIYTHIVKYVYNQIWLNICVGIDMVKTLVAKDYRVKPGKWGESKQRVQIMLTPTAIELVDAIAEQMELTRAEVIERLIRSKCLNLETLKEIAADDD
jgi:hypothetical protein